MKSLMQKDYSSFSTANVRAGHAKSRRGRRFRAMRRIAAVVLVAWIGAAGLWAWDDYLAPLVMGPAHTEETLVEARSATAAGAHIAPLELERNRPRWMHGDAHNAGPNAAPNAAPRGAAGEAPAPHAQRRETNPPPQTSLDASAAVPPADAGAPAGASTAASDTGRGANDAYAEARIAITRRPQGVFVGLTIEPDWSNSADGQAHYKIVAVNGQSDFQDVVCPGDVIMSVNGQTQLGLTGAAATRALEEIVFSTSRLDMLVRTHGRPLAIKLQVTLSNTRPEMGRMDQPSPAHDRPQGPVLGDPTPCSAPVRLPHAAPTPGPTPGGQSALLSRVLAVSPEHVNE